jgi:hypothetical protein
MKKERIIKKNSLVFYDKKLGRIFFKVQTIDPCYMEDVPLFWNRKGELMTRRPESTQLDYIPCKVPILSDTTASHISNMHNLTEYFKEYLNQNDLIIEYEE